MPENMVAARINENGKRDPAGNRIDYFYKEFLPEEQSAIPDQPANPSEPSSDQLF
jgi:hypothetical protein